MKDNSQIYFVYYIMLVYFMQKYYEKHYFLRFILSKVSPWRIAVVYGKIHSVFVVFVVTLSQKCYFDFASRRTLTVCFRHVRFPFSFSPKTILY